MVFSSVRAKAYRKKVSLLTVVLVLARLLVAAGVLGAGIFAVSDPAQAHSVGLRNTRTFVDPDTAQALIDRALATGEGVAAGDIIEYIVEFEPYENGAAFGPGGWVTFYVPSYGEIVGASFVSLQGGDFVDIPAPEPGAMWDGVGPLGGESPYGAPFDASVDGSLAQLYGDTGIFYSTSPDTAKYVGAADPATTPIGNNGYFVDPTACGQLEPADWDNCWAHNLWDKEMTDRFGTSGGSIVDSGRGTTPYLAGSPVAGPDTYYGLDYTGAVGPWQRIQYPNSMIGTGPAPDPADGDGPVAPTDSTAWVPVTPGVNDGVVLDESNPLPSSTTALRFAIGELRAVDGTDDYMWVKIRLRIITPPTDCTPIDAEVFGGDAGVDGNGKDHPWRYYVPISAAASACLALGKTGPTEVLPSETITYTVSAANSAVDPLTGVVITDVVDPSTTVVSISDGGVLAGDTITWPTIATMAPGEVVSYTVEVTAPATVGTTVINEARGVSNETAMTWAVWSTEIVSAPTTVTGHVFRDDDGNGVQDAGEPDLAGVDVDVTDGSGSVSVTTDGSGDWSTAVDAGTVTIDVDDTTVPTGYVLSTANDPQTVTASIGATTASPDVGYEPSPDLVVTKSPSASSIDEPGGPVTFTVLVQNSGVVDFTVSSMVDDVFGDLLDAGNTAVTSNSCVTLDGASVAVGETASCSFDGDVLGTASGPDHVDTVTVLVADDDGDTATGFDSATVAFVDVAPNVVVTKTPSAASVPEPGGPVTFTVGVSNPGLETVSLTTLTDDVFGDLFDAGNGAISSNTCVALDGTSLAGGGSVSCSFAAILVGDASDPDHVDTVTITATDDEGTPVTDSASATVGFADVPPVIDVTKTPSVASVPEPGGPVTFTVRIENTGIEDVVVTTLADDVFGDLLDAGNTAVSSNACVSLAGATITVGGASTCAFDADLAGNALDPDHVDTVTATVVDDDGTPATGSDSATVAFGDFVPTVEVTKTPSVSSVAEPGGTVTFTITVENTSPESVTLTSLTDDAFGDLLDAGNTAVTANSCSAAVPALLPGGVLTCSFAADLLGNGADPDHVNTVTAIVVDDEGSVGSDADSATVGFDDVTPFVEITKSATPTWVPEPGAEVVFGLSITNPTVESVTVTNLVDNVFGDLRDGGNPQVWANDCVSVGVLDAASTITCSFTALVEGDASSGDHVDVVAVEVADDEGTTAASTDSATVDVVDVLPDVDVMKTPSTDSVPETGQTVTFTVTIENASPEPVTVTSIVDDVYGDLGDLGNAEVSAADCHGLVGDLLAPGEIQSCSFDAWVAGTAAGPDHVDTVTVAVIDDDGSTAGEQDSATVGFDDVAPAVDLEKFASVSAVDEPGDAVTFTIRIDNTGTETVTLVSLDDDVFGDLLDAANESIVRAPGCPSVGDPIPTGASVTCSFVAFVAGDADGPDHVDTVVVIAADDEGTTATAQDSATVAIDAAPAGQIEGLVWWDVDGDTAVSVDEPRLPGIDVLLLDDSDTEVDATVTGPDGGYGFEGLAPGTYTVVVDVAGFPYGLALGVDPDATVDGRTGATVLADAAVTGLDFGARGTVTVGDRVWEDTNENGVQDPDEPSIGNARITIRWAGPDEILDTADDMAWVEWTAGSGRYERDDLPVGLYEIEVDPASVGGGLDSTTPSRVTVVLAAGADYQDGDFGFAPDGSALPRTGMDTDRLAVLAVGLVVLGVILIAGTRPASGPVRIDWERLG